MRFWLRQVDGEPEVELIGEYTYFWRSGVWSRREERRNIMAELLGPELTEELQITPGVWHLPGTPP